MNKIILLSYWVIGLTLTFILVLYYISWILDRLGMQLYNYSMSWTYLALLFIFGLYLYIALLKHANQTSWSQDLNIAFKLLFYILLFYLQLNSIFILILALEAQSMTLLYMISSLQSMNRSPASKQIAGGTSLEGMKQQQLWTLGGLFAQFWTSFLGAALLVYLCLRVSYIYSSLLWCDLSVFYEIFSFSTSIYWKPINMLLACLLIMALFIKAGLYPYYFWKPELYRNIAWLGMLWYVTLYSFAFLFVFIMLVSALLHAWTSAWYSVVWLTALMSFVLLANTLFIISELKVFLAYMSTFHALYIIIGAAMLGISGAISSIAYLIIYLIVITHFFVIIMGLRGVELQFISDLQFISRLSPANFSFICVFAAMSGIPPLLGFWAKISIVILLLLSQEYLLFVLALACGLYLMYFYLQNYRFNTELVHQFNYSYAGNTLIASFFLSATCFFPLLNVMAGFLINDLWNSCTLVCNLNLYELW